MCSTPSRQETLHYTSKRPTCPPPSFLIYFLHDSHIRPRSNHSIPLHLSLSLSLSLSSPDHHHHRHLLLLLTTNTRVGITITSALSASRKAARTHIATAASLVRNQSATLPWPTSTRKKRRIEKSPGRSECEMRLPAS
jgi:hypothetical protein